jgi:Skp family chaperone for outer membrane proteins
MDEDESIPILAIDALHNPGDEGEVAKFDAAMAELWRVVEQLGSAPVDNIQMVKDDIEKLEEELKQVGEKLREASEKYEEEVKKLGEEHRQAEAQNAAQKAALEVMRIE